MGGRKNLCPTNGFSVIVVDEDKHHANSARSMLCALNYHATAYTSPIEALEFLEGHAQVVDLALVAVDMELMHGFQFLDIVREDHKNVQVIMMSEETTMDIMKRCVELGACFLVKKPIDSHTIHNMWQHLDIKNSRMDNIKNLLKGNGEAGNKSYIKKNNKTKKAYICWNEYLQRKFQCALEILGEGASPRNIEILMNVEGVNRKHIASHLQCVNRISASKSPKSHQEGPSTSINSPDIQQEEIRADDMSHALRGGLSDNNVCAAMRRSIQFGTMYDESQYFSSSGDEATEDVVYTMEDGSAQDDDTRASSVFNAEVCDAETFSADSSNKVLNNNSSEGNDHHGDKPSKVLKLVDYSDSEDDEI
ncbi:hypothetical protein HU200_001337 [Digitaria exilis]|uniref:Response regulatory domain-containing protein n=1 Tax=Digitaria exilis TaxID=1010633 RepID=A0A835KV01_9POAL|nr:hypothetical protein HU200_001337 [Digitaria exilis]